MIKDHKCPKCGTVMCEKFQMRKVSEDLELAVPTGEYSCMKCGFDPLAEMVAK
jgi:DNA-directed RNA polymerase subunit M/transcription elongation factor TFIIS